MRLAGSLLTCWCPAVFPRPEEMQAINASWFLNCHVSFGGLIQDRHTHNKYTHAS